MIVHNGELIPDESAIFTLQSRAYQLGDTVSETMRSSMGRVSFWEEHYLRLMASMRILRMEIPMTFTMEYLSEQMSSLLEANQLLQSSAAIQLSATRNADPDRTPEEAGISFLIQATRLEHPFFIFPDKVLEIGLFKDYYKGKDLLASLNTHNRMIQVLGDIFALDNELDDCLILNHDKQVVQSLKGNVFLVKGSTIITPPIEDGCPNTVIRKKLLEMVDNLEAYELEERSLSPFELQQANELFVSNAIDGIIPYDKYRKKSFEKVVSRDLLSKLSAQARLSVQ